MTDDILASKGCQSTFQDWLDTFNYYILSHGLGPLFENVEKELELIGWPEKVNEEDINEAIRHNSKIKVRLIALLSLIKGHRTKLDFIFSNMLFFRKQMTDIPGKTKEDKKKYAELSMLKEISILERIETIENKINSLKESYDVKYWELNHLAIIVRSKYRQEACE